MEGICVNVINPVHFIPIPQGTLPLQPILWQNCGKITYPPALIVLPFRNGMGYHNRNVRINSVNDASISRDNFVKFGPVTSELTALICECQVRHGQKNWRISSNISGYTGPIFAIFSLYESALHTDDGSVRYFPICQAMLPW